MEHAEVVDGLKMAQVEKLTGVGAHTLRAWERRYGVPTPGRSDGWQRMYSFADVEVIRRMQALSLQGIPLARAARVARGEAARDQVVMAATGRVEGLLDALLRFDEPRATDTWHGLLEEHDILRLFNEVVAPALRTIGDGWHAGTISVGQEHFASNWVRSRLEALARQVTPMMAAPVVVLACPEGERHELALLMLNVLLRFQGFSTIFLGQETPAESLVRVLEDVQPVAVALHATTREAALALAELAPLAAEAAPLTTLVVGGPGVGEVPALADFHNVLLGPPELGAAVGLFQSIRRAPRSKGNR